ncbi:MAG: hypothetical protein KatS3mg108_0468 [Isosphaeraceae bacterium]|nr:MAG: hypothetical protein KatS3mg108_0468 [Isosphaeraceae bacterium]
MDMAVVDGWAGWGEKSGVDGDLLPVASEPVCGMVVG